MTFLENGNIGLNTDTPGSKFDVHSAGAIVAQFNKTGTGNSYIQQLLAGAAKWKHGFTTATGAFDIIDDVNALTRLSVLNTGQLKLNAYTSTSAFTGTTAGFLAFDASGNILSVTSPATSPAGTTGAVQFNNAGAFGADSTNFFWDDTNNRLGVGTNAPSATGHLKGSGSTSATTSLLVQNSGGTAAVTVGDDLNTTLGGNLNLKNSNTYINNTSNTIWIAAVQSGTSDVQIIPGRQVNINNLGSYSAQTSALLQVDSTTKGVLFPRMTTTQKNAIASPAAGLMVYDTDLNKLCVRTAAAWETITSI
jgi:hypothetical protein